ncbi:hypothetical protein Tco_1086598 [Tanacetum coccineum]
MSSSSKSTKSQLKSSGKSVQSEEPVFEVADLNMPHDQEGNLGDNENDSKEMRLWPLDTSLEGVRKARRGVDQQGWREDGARRTRGAGPLRQRGVGSRLVRIRTHDVDDRRLVEFFGTIPQHKIQLRAVDLKYPSRRISELGHTRRLLQKTKDAIYDLPGIEDLVPNIWSPVKVAYDKYALWGISHWREQYKSFYAFARVMQSRGYVYSTKRILAVTRVSVMSKHGYEYLEEIVV